MQTYEVIKQIIADRKTSKTVPLLAPRLEVFRLSGLSEMDFKKQVVRLVKEKKIKIRTTVNDFSFELCDK